MKENQNGNRKQHKKQLGLERGGRSEADAFMNMNTFICVWVWVSELIIILIIHSRMKI